MNSKSMILLRTMWAATGRINVLKHSKSKQKKNAAIAMLSGYAVIAVFLALFIFYVCMGLGKLGYPEMAADLTASMITLVALIFTLLKANAYLYAFKEYDMLMAMPFSVETVVTGRFLLMYFRDLPWNVLISFSALAGYAVSVHPGPAVYILWILLTPFLPLLPMTVSTLLGYLVARVGARVRHKTLIQTVLTFLVVLPVFAIQYIAEYIARNNLGDEVLETSSAALSAMAMVIPTIGWFEKAVLSCDVLAALLLILVSVLLFAAVVFLITKNYRRINSALAAVSGRKKSREGTKSFR